jgi:hypothetical protein
MMRFVRLANRSIGVLPGIVTFIGVSFCRIEVTAMLSQHVCGSSLPVRAA